MNPVNFVNNYKILIDCVKYNNKEIINLFQNKYKIFETQNNIYTDKE
jgi:hypothetical protein